jgi:hypothetical protein
MCSCCACWAVQVGGNGLELGADRKRKRRGGTKARNSRRAAAGREARAAAREAEAASEGLFGFLNASLGARAVPVSP